MADSRPAGEGGLSVLIKRVLCLTRSPCLKDAVSGVQWVYALLGDNGLEVGSVFPSD